VSEGLDASIVQGVSGTWSHKVFLAVGGSELRADASLPCKWHLDRFIHFCRTHRHTDRPRYNVSGNSQHLALRAVMRAGKTLPCDNVIRAKLETFLPYDAMLARYLL